MKKQTEATNYAEEYFKRKIETRNAIKEFGKIICIAIAGISVGALIMLMLTCILGGGDWSFSGSKRVKACEQELSHIRGVLDDQSDWTAFRFKTADSDLRDIGRRLDKLEAPKTTEPPVIHPYQWNVPGLTLTNILVRPGQQFMRSVPITNVPILNAITNIIRKNTITVSNCIDRTSQDFMLDSQ